MNAEHCLDPTAVFLTITFGGFVCWAIGVYCGAKK